jgi:hypothetical protein
MCQAIEFHGEEFRWADIRRNVMRKEGAKSGRDPATRQVRSSQARRTGQKAPLAALERS